MGMKKRQLIAQEIILHNNIFNKNIKRRGAQAAAFAGDCIEETAG